MEKFHPEGPTLRKRYFSYIKLPVWIWDEYFNFMNEQTCTLVGTNLRRDENLVWLQRLPYLFKCKSKW